MKTRDPKILSTHPAGLDLGGLKKLYLPSDKAFALVDVPEMQFVMIDGEGNPAGETYSRAMRWLFSVVYPIKLIAKARMGKHFLEPPMECLWWADDMEDFVKGNKETFKWRIMIVTADWVSDEMFNEALSKTEERLGEVPGRLRLGTYDEGTSVQMMHIGPPSKLGPIVARLHQEFLPENSLIPNGHHHEIYLNDPRRVASEKLKTVVRQPVRSSA